MVPTQTKFWDSSLGTGVGHLYLWCKFSDTCTWRLFHSTSSNSSAVSTEQSSFFLSGTFPVSRKWVKTLETATLFRWISGYLIWNCPCTFACNSKSKTIFKNVNMLLSDNTNSYAQQMGDAALQWVCTIMIWHSQGTKCKQKLNLHSKIL